MQKNERVLIAEDPVKWMTYVRRHAHVEPSAAMIYDAVPYYTRRGDNSCFSPEETDAINSSTIRPGIMLVRCDGFDNCVKYVPVDQILPMINCELQKMPKAVEDFLLCLGGRDILITTYSMSECSEKECRTVRDGFSLDSKVNLIQFNGKKSQQNDVDNGAKVQIMGKLSVQVANEDLGAAIMSCEKSPFIKQMFGNFLDKIIKNKVHGQVSQLFYWEQFSSIITKFQESISVAARYKLISLKYERQFSSEVKKLLHNQLSWQYNATFN